MNGIAIVGGGPGGLTLARILHTHGIAATVYERDDGPGARTQGGSLDLHPETGQYALRAAGLEEEFHALSRLEGEDLVLVDPDGTELLRMVAPPPDDAAWARPEIDRADLRRILLDSLPGEAISWGRALRTATARAGGGFRLCFDDGTEADCDVLIGADGAYSRVRPLLSDAEPTQLGINMVECGIPDADRTAPELAAMVGRGNYWLLGTDQAVAAQRCGDGRVRVHFTFNTPEAWLADGGIPFGDPAATRAALNARFAGWPPQVAALIADCDDTIETRSIATLPVGLTWAPVRGVTLLGDAAHLMPPVGHGANAALRDAAELAAALAARPGDPHTAIKAYEPEMFARTAKVAEMSTRVQEIMRTSGAQGVLRFFSGQPT
jgi:2-polyprenyl-6-methoxyphenol hydroxylase-like FAD-dependent oxidoreductase